VVNLLDNAIKYTPAGGAVRLKVAADGGSAVLEVVDTGPGIPGPDQPHVFERFYRGDPSRNRNTGGTGLGLSICKAIVDRAGGEIHIDSLPDIGTAVMVILPVARQAEDVDPLSRIETLL